MCGVPQGVPQLEPGALAAPGSLSCSVTIVLSPSGWSQLRHRCEGPGQTPPLPGPRGPGAFPSGHGIPFCLQGSHHYPLRTQARLSGERGTYRSYFSRMLRRQLTASTCMSKCLLCRLVTVPATVPRALFPKPHAQWRGLPGWGCVQGSARALLFPNLPAKRRQACP